MKRLELYFIRTVLIAVLATIAASPFLAVSHLLQGLLNGTLETTHLLALGYLLLIALAMFLVSPAFSDHKSRAKGLSAENKIA